MTHEEKLTAVINKICELLNGSSLDPMRNTDRTWGMDLPHPIREAEVLAALCGIKTDYGNFGYSMDTYGSIFWIEEHATELTTHEGCEWILGQPLSSQPTEVIDFLFNVLNCE